jgi:hypothetical protein
VLSKLENADARAARVVELRFFGGRGEDEVAEVLNGAGPVLASILARSTHSGVWMIV